MIIRVELRLRRPRLDSAAVGVVAGFFATFSAPLARRRGVAEILSTDVILVGDRASAAAHRAANGAEGATDVITVSYAATPLEPARAELIVDPLVALRAAAARDPDTLLPEEKNLPWDADQELALYLAHGFDHLAGSDDASAAGYRAMRRRELRWLADIEPLPKLFR